MIRKNNRSFVIEIIISVILGFYLYYLFGDQILLSKDFISNIITFLSIVFGFYITSFSIFTTSRYVASLYKISDADNKSVSLMDSLIHKYKIGLILTLISIFYGLVIFLIIGDKEAVLLESYTYLGILPPLIFLNCIYAFEMMNILIKVIKQTAKLNQE